MASYMDMVTVLMCMFIVLFAMSTVDQEKFEQLRNSLATGFGSVPSELVDTADGVIVPPEKVDEDGDGFTVIANSDRDKRALELAVLESDRLLALREQLRAALVASGLEHTVDFDLDERGLTVRLVGSETFFESNRTVLSGVAVRVLDSIGPILAASGVHGLGRGARRLPAVGAPVPDELGALLRARDRGAAAPGRARRDRRRSGSHPSASARPGRSHPAHPTRAWR